jgi:1,2-diacylglycerol 3-alpha-glucosyltransferase
MNRGIESFFREAFDGLKFMPGIEARLLKGKGRFGPTEHVIWSLPRTSKLGGLLGTVFARNSYVVEQWTSFPAVARTIRAFRPEVVFYSDANLGFLLFRLRRYLGVPFKLLFSNGGPVHPPFNSTDYVHQVAPCYREEALRAGESPARHFFVPYGIKLAARPGTRESGARQALRRKLRLPVDRKVVLSVGWIRRCHKRMDYLIEELARLPQPRPFLQLIGALDAGSREIISLGKRLLGADNFAVRSVPYHEVSEYYCVADCFALASLREGFGRVYLEAFMYGLPVVAQRNPVTEYVLGSQAVLEDLSKPGTLAASLATELRKPADLRAMQGRWDWVRTRFSWEVLAGSYVQMFDSCAHYR